MEIQTTIHQLSPVEEVNETKIPVFPQEIVVEILSRLPVKSLCRFKCVSKHWLALITDPHLTISHLKQTITNARLCSERSRVIIHWTNAYFLDYESFGKNDENLVALELGHPIKPTSVSDLSRDKDGFPMFWDIIEDGKHVFLVPDQFSHTYKIEIFGICNGLVCLSPHTGIIYLLNPSTREFKRIPDSPYDFIDEHRISQNFGFGYANDDYKIVKAAAAVFVYSLKADSWRFVCRNPYLGEYEPGVFLNGALHWMAYRDNECLVAAFGLKEETFFDMPAPNIVESSNDFVVGVLDGYLCVLHMCNGMHDEFWVMNEYGVGESWTRITLGFSYGVMKPLCLARNGETLFSVDGELLLYNFDDGSCRYLVVDGIMEREELFEAEMYFETLVSPNAAVGLEHDAISNLGFENL